MPSGRPVRNRHVVAAVVVAMIGISAAVATAADLAAPRPSAADRIGLPSAADETGQRNAEKEIERLPGVELAESAATATGIAITPLLGVSAVGAWRYLRTDASQRHRLPWFASVWFWVPGLALALLLVIKDPLLGVVPTAKKPLDAADVIENKASAALASPTVVPLFVSAFTVAGGLAERSPAEPGLALAGFDLVALGSLPRALALGVGAVAFLAAFLCIWLAFHVINVLILLSPFGLLDVLLRSVKLVVLVTLLGATAIHPYLGFLVSVLILVAAIPIAGWAFRLSVFGGVLATDLLLFRHRRKGLALPLRSFTAGKLGAARPRTYGVVTTDEEGLLFSYRPWLVLPRRSERLPEGCYAVLRGLLYPGVGVRSEGSPLRAVLRLPPRYRSHEFELASELRIFDVEDLALRRGLRALFGWVREMAGRGVDVASGLGTKARGALSGPG